MLLKTQNTKIRTFPELRYFPSLGQVPHTVFHNPKAMNGQPSFVKLSLCGTSTQTNGNLVINTKITPLGQHLVSTYDNKITGSTIVSRLSLVNLYHLSLVNLYHLVNFLPLGRSCFQSLLLKGLILPLHPEHIFRSFVVTAGVFLRVRALFRGLGRSHTRT